MITNRREPPASIIGVSAALRTAIDLARRLGPRKETVLLIGATGTGKELFAQHIHYWSGRPGELVAVNCAALPATLVEAELFGHTADAFTGARRPKPGLLEIADGRTLLLDEITSLALEAQGTLLRVLETGEVRRVGATTARHVQVRFIAAAQDDLHARIAQGRFRLDLYERLAQGVVRIKPLAERPEDIVLLARHFAQLDGRVLEDDALGPLMSHGWPGNVRELRNVITRAGWLVENGTLPRTSIEEAIGTNSPRTLLLDPRNRDTERRDLLAACEAHGWHAGRTAAALGWARSTLFKRLKAHGLSLRVLRGVR